MNILLAVATHIDGASVPQFSLKSTMWKETSRGRKRGIIVNGFAPMQYNKNSLKANSGTFLSYRRGQHQAFKDLTRCLWHFWIRIVDKPFSVHHTVYVGVSAWVDKPKCQGSHIKAWFLLQSDGLYLYQNSIYARWGLVCMEASFCHWIFLNNNFNVIVILFLTIVLTLQLHEEEKTQNCLYLVVLTVIT